MKIVNILSAAIALGLPATASAQDRPKQDSGLSFTISAGVVSAPSFLGDDETQTSIFPNISISYGNKLKASLRGIEFTAIERNGWKAGGTLSYDRGREESPDASDFMIAGDASTDLVGLGDIDGTIEVGGFVEYGTRAIAAKLEFSQGVDGGHDGLSGKASLNFRGKFDSFGRQAFFSVGPVVSFGDDAYNSTFFDVSAAQSSASGISEYDANGGINSYGMSATVMMPLTEKTSLVGFANFDQLTGDVGGSSIVKERGSRDQLTAGMFLNYRF